MDLVLLGAHGSGKGTQAAYLQEDLGLTHVASGDLFRDHLQRKTELGMQAGGYMETGALVPDAITIAMLRERVSQPDAINGVLLDGFPRTMEQAIALNEMMAFHLTANPFRTCPFHRCHGEHLYQRADDNPETVRARLVTFHRQTAPVIDYYRLINLLVTVPGHGSVEEVKRATLEAVRKIRGDG
jgi:adenylate kinase